MANKWTGCEKHLKLKFFALRQVSADWEVAAPDTTKNYRSKIFCETFDPQVHLWWLGIKEGVDGQFTSYLPGAGDAVINKAAPSGWGPGIALRWGWGLRFPQTWETRAQNFW